MWPFKRKTREPATSPMPMPEPWDWDTMVGHRVRELLNADMSILASVAQTGIPRLSIRFEDIGTATVALNYSEGEGPAIVPLYWVAHDPDAGRRGFGLADYAPDGSPRWTEPASILEKTGRRLTLRLDNGDVLMMPASWPVPDEREIVQLTTNPNTQRIPVAAGTGPQRYVYVPTDPPVTDQFERAG